MISIVTGIVAGLGIEAVGLFGAAGGSSVIIKIVRLAPSIIRIAKAVRSNPDHSRLHQHADEIVRELESKCLPKAPKRREPVRVRKRPTDRRQSSTQRGYGSKWQRYRAAYLLKPENALCRICKANNIVKAASVIDHIVPHRGDWKLFWNKENHQPLCPRCHSQKTVREDGGFGNRRLERNPMPVKKKPTKEDIAKKILAMEAARDRGKNNYAKSSKLFDELLQTLKPGDKVKLPDGRTFTVVDPFVRPDGTLKKVWKPAGIARYDWEISQD